MVHTWFKSLFAGLLISLGCISFLSSDNKLVGSILFSIGLLTIIHFKQYLFTGLLCNFKLGNNFYDNISNIFNLIFVYIGNIFGTSFGSGLLHLSRLDYTDKINSIVDIKRNDSMISLIALGILCEACIFIAVKSKKELFTIMAVTIFVFCGFEHCIADWFYLLSSDYSGTTNIWIFYVTLGNIISGILLSLIYNHYNKLE